MRGCRFWLATKGLKGNFSHTIDTKGRMIIPSKLRARLGLSFVVTKSLDGCLLLYPADEWDKFEKKLEMLPITNKNTRAFKRFFQADAVDITLDSQGRFTMPSTLLEFAKIKKDIVIVGVGEKAEVWSKEMWNNQDDIDPESLALSIETLGIIL